MLPTLVIFKRHVWILRVKYRDFKTSKTSNVLKVFILYNFVFDFIKNVFPLKY